MKTVFVISSCVSRDRDNPTGVRTKNNGNFIQFLEPMSSVRTGTITSVAKDNLVLMVFEVD